MSGKSIKTTVEIKGIEIDIEVYYNAKYEVWGDQPDSIEIEIESITRQGTLKKVSSRLRNKILTMYENSIDNYIAEDVYDYGC